MTLNHRPPHPNPVYVSSVVYARLEAMGYDMYFYRKTEMMPVSDPGDEMLRATRETQGQPMDAAPEKALPAPDMVTDRPAYWRRALSTSPAEVAVKDEDAPQGGRQ